MYKISLPGKSILRDYFQENRTSRRPFLLLRISFPEDLFLYNSSQLVDGLEDEEERHEGVEDVLGELGEELDERRSLKVVMLHDQLTKENETNN